MSLTTAGIFVLVDGRVLFQAGPDQTGKQVGLVRIGGRLESGETPLDCALREAREEASISVRVIDSPTTYCLTLEEPPRAVAWQNGSPRPLHASATSHVFIGLSADQPSPTSETHALILLSPSELVALGESKHTLGSLQKLGSQIVLRDPTEREHLFELPVAPRWAGMLAEVLILHPDLSLWDL